MTFLPKPRGPLTETLFSMLTNAAVAPTQTVPPAIDALADDDLQLALYCCYELHYRGFDGIDDALEWDPRVLTFRRGLESAFEAALLKVVPRTEPDGSIPEGLFALAKADEAPSMSRFLQRFATADQFREFLIHRSAYQLKEADPHSWVIPRLDGQAKAALLEVQFDEYGSGKADRIHAELYARSMAAVGLDPTYGAYIDVLPGATLATVNLMSMFGLHRRWRGATVGHLALFEMTSPIPNRRYADGLRRLGFNGQATEFFDEHVVADAVHEMIAAHDLAGAFEGSDLAADVIFGAAALIEIDLRWERFVLDAWDAGRTSLLTEPATSKT